MARRCSRRPMSMESTAPIRRKTRAPAASSGSRISRRSSATSKSWMPRRSRLPAKTVSLSSSSPSASRARSRPCWRERDAQRASADRRGRNFAGSSAAAPAGPDRLIREAPMATATHDLAELKRRMQGAIHVLKQELGGLRTGRASPSLLEPVHVEAYGTHMPLNQLATVSVPEPRLLTVQVWDKSMVSAVERAIINANLGLNPATEGQLLRLRIPELNEERRKELVKVAHRYSETARVAVRHVRRDGLDILKKLEKDHKISKDDHDRDTDQVQKATDQAIAEIDHALAVKEKEILTV